MSAQDSLNAAALAYAASQGWTLPAPTPTPAPTPAPTAAPIFDGRAKTYIAKYGALPYMNGTTAQKSATDPTPFAPTTYAAYAYMRNDLRVASDSDLGMCFLAAPPAGDHSPWNTGSPVSNTLAQLSHGRATRLGQWSYFATAYKILSMDPWDWASYLSLNYETLQWDQVALQGVVGSDGKRYWSLYVHTGVIPAPVLAQQLKPIVVGQAERFVIAMKEAADATGELAVYSVDAAGVKTLLFDKQGVATYLTGSNPPYNPVSAAQLATMSVLDKGPLYCGWWTQTRTPAPTQKVLWGGWSQWATLTDAVASLG